MNKSWKLKGWMIVVGALVLLPVVRGLLNLLSPELVLLAALTGAVVFFLRKANRSTDGRDDDEGPYCGGSGQSAAKVQPVHSRAMHMAGPAEVEQPNTGLAKLLGDLWNSKRHGLVMLCAALWLICPLDLDWIPIAGWCDDGFAIVLGVKHFLDLFRRDVSAAHAAMQSHLQPLVTRESLTGRASTRRASRRITSKSTSEAAA